MKKNDILSGRVDAVGMNGEGIIRFDGTTFFVPFCYEGEEVSFKVLKIAKNIGYGKVEKIKSPSIYRSTPLCPVFYKCGGCQLQHVVYDVQPSIKAQNVVNCFKKIAALNVDLNKIFSSPNAYGYRNKLQLPTRNDRFGDHIGFFRENSHDVIDTDTCPIHPKWADAVIAVVKDFVKKTGVSLYNDVTGKGLLRHVVVREINGEYLVTVVINGDGLPKKDVLIEDLKRKFDDFSLYLNVNKSDSNVIMGDEYRLVYGKGYIELTEFNVTYRIGPQAFFQVNTPVKTEIYNDVLSFIDGDPVVIDAYAGAGVLTAMLARRAKRVYGVEIVKEACDSAEELAKSNYIGNMNVICGDCSKVLPPLIGKVKDSGERSVIVFDPPRKGVDANVIGAVLDAMPDEIIYISCSPQTLARDVGLLLGSLKYENGRIINLSGDFLPNYEIKFIGVYDMFAQTKHVETLVCLSRKF